MYDFIPKLFLGEIRYASSISFHMNTFTIIGLLLGGITAFTQTYSESYFSCEEMPHFDHKIVLSECLGGNGTLFVVRDNITEEKKTKKEEESSLEFDYNDPDVVLNKWFKDLDSKKVEFKR